MTNVYAVAVPLLLFASAYVGYAGLQTQSRHTPRMVRDKVDTLQINSHYRIPDPFVEPMNPKGIRISIPDEPGIERFGFHGNLNKPIVGFQAGPLNGDITRPTNGRWTYVDRNLKTKPGDVLHFWVFVQNNGLGYRKDNFRFTVKDLKEVTLDPINVQPSIISRPPPTIAMAPEINNMIDNNLVLEENVVSQIEFQKVQTQLNETLALLSSLNNKIDPLNRELKLLREIVTDLARSTAGNTKLILRHSSASIPGNSLEFVRSIVVERLGLTDFYSKILAATQIPDGIVFDVVSMYEKRLILTRAKDVLGTSKFKIDDYTAEMPPANTNCIRIVDEIEFPTNGDFDGDQPTDTTFGRDPYLAPGTTTIREPDQPTDTTFGRDPNLAPGTTTIREPDQPTDILPTDSLDSFDDEIAKKIDIRMASEEVATTTL